MQPGGQRDEVEVALLMLLIRRFRERAKTGISRRDRHFAIFTSVRKQS